MTTFIFLISLLFLYVNSIEKQCNLQHNNLSCPQNSFCGSFAYCVCDPGWVLACQTKASPLSLSSQQTFSVNSAEQSFFQIVPSTVEAYSIYKFRICVEQQEKVDLVLKLWYDDGQISKLSGNNKIGEREIQVQEGCTQLFTNYILFDTQKNGESEFMILGIIVKNNSAVTEQKIKLSVFQMIIIDIQTIYLLYFIFGGVFLLIFAISIAICSYQVWKRRQSRKTKKKNNSTLHFQQYMPEKTFQEFSPLPQELMCAVCLQEFTKEEKMRKTICNHMFHSQCLDQWCCLNLICPICRSSLDEESLQALRNSLNHSDLEQIVDMENGMSMRNSLLTKN